MTNDDRASYKRQFDQAQRRLPRGHVIHHVMWREGHLSTMSHRPERPARDEPEARPGIRRGVQQQDLFT